jgi:putative copper resistance protein D
MFEWDAWLFSNTVSKFVIYLTSFITAGSMMFLSFLKPSDKNIVNFVLKITLLAGVLSAIFTVSRISIQAGQLYDEGLIGLFDWEMISIVAQGPLGASSYIRLLGVVLLLICIPFPKFHVLGTLLGSLFLVSSFAMIGHATNDQLILGTLIIIHLFAVSFWIGALFPLHKLASDQNGLTQAGELAHKFGQLAAIAVPVLTLVGFAFSVFLVGSPVNLIGTQYGMLLLIKVIFVGVLLSFAALNKIKFVPALRNKSYIAAKHLRTSIKLEFVVFLIIFAITAILTTAVHLPGM